MTTGRHRLLDPLWNVRVDIVSQRDPRPVSDKLEVIVKSGALAVDFPTGNVERVTEIRSLQVAEWGFGQQLTGR